MRKKLLLLTLMSCLPPCLPAIAEQPQPPAGPQQKVEQVEESAHKLNQALFAAVGNDLEDEVIRLIAQGADVNAKDKG